MSSFMPQLSIFFDVKTDLESPYHLKSLSGRVLHPYLGRIANLSGYIISRRMLRGRFLEICTTASRELHDFSTALFDKNGFLKPRLKSGYRSGTGRWGDELSHGIIVYIQDFSVDQPYRHMGIGSLMIQKLIESEYISRDPFNSTSMDPPSVPAVIYWPVGTENDVLKAFLRKNTFRRIGRTSFLGLSLDPEHPARKLAASDDVPSLTEIHPAPTLRTSMEHAPEDRCSKFPLHAYIVQNKDISIRDLLIDAHRNDAHSIHVKDDVGFRPMHIAVLSNNMIAFDTLLALGAEADLHAYDNTEGATPLEMHYDFMLSDRQFMETRLLGIWKGFPDKLLTFQYKMKNAMKIPTRCQSVEEYIEKTKFGCSCGECLGGWLSPRMAFQLECKASFYMESMPIASEYTFRGGRVIVHPKDIGKLVNGAYIPPSLHSKVNAVFYQGFTELFRTVYDLLSVRPPLMPNDEAIGLRAHLVYTLRTFYYFQRGGKIEYVMDAITRGAMEDSAIGDGVFLETFGDSEEYRELPTCENDWAFGLVRDQMGLST